MSLSTEVSSPFSTSGGGSHFEAHVQAYFVILMLTNGYAPWFSGCSITKIEFQAKVNGYDTDDLIVFVENSNAEEKHKLLIQVKHSVDFIRSSSTFGMVIQAAWNDFNNPKVFSQKDDAIALITGPLSNLDIKTILWILEQAHHKSDGNDFFRHIEQPKYNSLKTRERLGVIRYHLKSANNGIDLSNDELYNFLKHFYLLGFDLGKEDGVILSLLQLNIARFYPQGPQLVWSRVVDIVQTWNQTGGTISRENMPPELRKYFQLPIVVKKQKKNAVSLGKSNKSDWNRSKYAPILALVNLIGIWDDNNTADIALLTELTEKSYDELIKDIRDVLNDSDSPLSLKNGRWEIRDREKLFKSLGSQILDRDLDKFKELSISVLTEHDPAFDKISDEQYVLDVYGGTFPHSRELRKGLADGLAILGNNSAKCTHCSLRNIQYIAYEIIQNIFIKADWILWRSLNDILPSLAEAAPDAFLAAVENSLKMFPCPFDQLFAQEGKGIFSGNYLTGLLWALESLAWEDKYLVKVCVILGELANHDPGGQWVNRPSHSLYTIFLPWLPQTLASVKKRFVAVKTLCQEWPEIGWKLLLHLLPGQFQTSTGSHKPSWRKSIPINWQKGVSGQERREQATLYAELAVSLAKHDTDKLITLIDHFNNLPKQAFNSLIEVLSSDEICGLSEDKRNGIWEHLNRFIIKHRKFPDAEWSLPDEILKLIEAIVPKVAPEDLFYSSQYLFSDYIFEYFDRKENWNKEAEKFSKRKEEAIEKIFNEKGLNTVIKFAESVYHPDQVGYALGRISDILVEQTILPHFLDSDNLKYISFANGFINKRYEVSGYEWCDNLDITLWTDKQKVIFLMNLPFREKTWDRVNSWLGNSQGEYWLKISVYPNFVDENQDIAIEKLLEYGRSFAAADLLYRNLNYKKQVDIQQCIRALLPTKFSEGNANTMDRYYIVELIKFLQSNDSMPQDVLAKIEMAYIELLDDYSGVKPITLENKLANDPEFFCDGIKLIYRSDKKDVPARELTEERKAAAENAWRLIDDWKTIPGMQGDTKFVASVFSEWMQHVKRICSESGHLNIALLVIGKVLVYSPADPDGLWIHRAIGSVLNEKDSDKIREGFYVGIINSRGSHFIDPTGKPEKELSELYRQKAEDVENAGFHRFAGTLRDLAEYYEHEAERTRLRFLKQEQENAEE